jgi:uncharacterized protein
MIFKYFLNHKKNVFCPDALKKWHSGSSLSRYDNFKKIFNVKYLPHLVFDSYHTFLKVIKIINKNVKKGFIDKQKFVVTNILREKILMGYKPKIVIEKMSDIIGWGVVVEEDIYKGQFVGEYVGVVKKKTRFVIKRNMYCMSYTTHPVSNPYVIDAKDIGNFTRFINHSSNPNLNLVSVIVDGLIHMIFFANQDISKSSQLTFDYGDGFWDDFKTHNQQMI